MASQLSDEEFQRLQTQLIELRTSNYGLEEQCRKLRIEKQRLEEKVDALEREYQKLQKTINRSKKAKDLDLLLNKNENLQKKLVDQEDEFRLQSKALLHELSTLVAANEKLEQELNALKKQESITGAPTGPEQEVAEKTAVTEMIAKEWERAEKELGDLRETIHLFSSSEADGDQDDSVRSNEGVFVQVGESDVTYQKRRITSQTDILKKAEQKLQHLEAHQKNLTDTLARLELEQEEKKKVETELQQVQEKLRRKQESLMQLQDEKEKLYAESRKAYEQLQRTKDQELNDLKEKNQRLQVQLNNAQSAMQDFKEKTYQMVNEMKTQILVLNEKSEKNSAEHLLELEAKVIDLECILGETKKELQSVKLLKNQQETDLVRVQEKLTELQSLTVEREEQVARLSEELEENRALAEKRLSLIDEMSIRMKQKGDDYKHRLSNLTNEFSKREEELKKEVNVLQEEVEKLAPLQRRLDDSLVQIKSLEAMRGRLERRQKEAEDVAESARTFYQDALDRLKAEHSQEVLHVKLTCENREKILEEELAMVKSESEKKSEALNRAKQQLHDAGEEKQLAEKKGVAVMKDLRRQLAGERKRVEKLQERLRDTLNEGSHSKTELSKSNDPETSSISSWSLMSGNCETRDSSTRENSIVAGSISNINGNVSPPPEEQDLEQENHQLLARVMALQQEKWVLEEKINHLEQGSSAMADDLMRKTALIQFYCMEGRSDPVATSTSSPSTERLSMKKFVEMLKGDEHVHESNRRMQRMLEETLTKNMHLQSDLEQLSREVVRLSKGTDNNPDT